MGSSIRRPRGTGTNRVALYVEVDPEFKQKFTELAQATGASKWALVHAMIDRAVQDLAEGSGDWLPMPDVDQETLLSLQEVKPLRKSA